MACDSDIPTQPARHPPECQPGFAGIRSWAVEGGEQLAYALDDFRTWYNLVRPHQHLGARTPAEAWAGIDPYAAARRAATYFSAWDGMLTGYYIRR